MLCRVAESLYWMARYIERAENVARFIDVNLNLSLDAPANFVESQQWMALVTSSGDDELFLSRYPEANQQNVSRFLSFDEENPNSIISCLKAARENARSVREIISSEMWEQVNQFYLHVKSASESKVLPDEIKFYKDVKLASHLFIGLAEATMSHGEGWHFLRLGRLLERADKTGRILDVRYFMLLPNPDYINTPLDSVLLGILLKSASGFEMYRKKYQLLKRKCVVDFLIFDEQFPRSLNYCIEQSKFSLEKIMGSQSIPNMATEELGVLKGQMKQRSIDQLLDYTVHKFIDSFQLQLNQVDHAVRSCFFDLASRSQLQAQQQ